MEKSSRSLPDSNEPITVTRFRSSVAQEYSASSCAAPNAWCPGVSNGGSSTRRASAVSEQASERSATEESGTEEMSTGLSTRSTSSAARSATDPAADPSPGVARRELSSSALMLGLRIAIEKSSTLFV